MPQSSNIYVSHKTEENIIVYTDEWNISAA